MIYSASALNGTSQYSCWPTTLINSCKLNMLNWYYKYPCGHRLGNEPQENSGACHRRHWQGQGVGGCLVILSSKWKINFCIWNLYLPKRRYSHWLSLCNLRQQYTLDCGPLTYLPNEVWQPVLSGAQTVDDQQLVWIAVQPRRSNELLKEPLTAFTRNTALGIVSTILLPNNSSPLEKQLLACHWRPRQAAASSMAPTCVSEPLLLPQPILTVPRGVLQEQAAEEEKFRWFCGRGEKQNGKSKKGLYKCQPYPNGQSQ